MSPPPASSLRDASLVSPRAVASAPTSRALPARKLRVVFCLDSMGLGGTELNAARVAEHLDRSRFELAIACMRPEGPLASRFAAMGVPVHAFPIPNLYGPAALRQGLRLAGFLRAWGADVVHSHDIYTSIFATVWARVAGVRLVLASRRWSEPPRPIHARLSRIAYRLAHDVLTNSERIADAIRHDGLAARRVQVIRNFVEDEAFAPLPADDAARLRAELGIAAGAPVVGCIARLEPVKDHATLLHAAAAVVRGRPATQFVLVGDGSCESALRALAASLGIEGNVKFAGYRPNRPNLHGMFDVSTLCSRNEAFPNSVVEAMAAGRPVVGTDVGGIAEAVAQGRTGLLAPVGDAPALATAIERLLGDDVLRARLGMEGRAAAESRHGAAGVIATLESLYLRRSGR